MRIGIDLGGTKTEIICLNKNNGKELYRHRVPTVKNYGDTIKNIRGLVELAEETTGETGTVGMGIPGTVSSVTGLVKNANSTWLNGQALDKDLQEALNRPVRVQNDANCFAVSEATDGAAAGKHMVFGVIIGTGCGAGIAIDGQAHAGINGIGGEWGHNPLPYPDEAENPGPECYCGRNGCMETWISGPGFKKDYQRTNNEALSTHDIIAAADSGEAKALAALGRYIDRLARGLAYVINIIDPDVIILGGGMSNISQLYEGVPENWGKYIFSDTIDTTLLPPRFGDSSGVRGAAWLWNNE